MLVPTLISSISLALLSISLYRPYTSHLKLHHASLPPDAIERGACIVHSEQKHCLDVALHRESGTAYLVCDEDAGTGRWDPLRGHWGEQTRAKIWSWKIDEPDTPLAEIDIPVAPPGGLHPTSISIVPSYESNRTLLVLLANHGSLTSSGHVDIFTHDLQASSAPLRYHSRIEAEALIFRGRTKGGAWSVEALPEQWSPTLAPSSDGDAAAGEHRLPSFFFTLKPDFPSAPTYLAHRPTFTQFAASVMLGRSVYDHRAPSSDVGLYIARANLSTIVTSARTSQYGWPPVLKAWDGAGEAAGRNSTRPVLFVASAASDRAEMMEWEQHWVTDLRSSLSWVKDPYPHALNAREDGNVRIYSPSYASFTEERLKHTPSAIEADGLGRIWLAQSLDSSAVLERWIEWLRLGKQGEAPPRPRGKVDFITHLFRLGPAVAHSWELERLKYARQRGIFLPKEYYVYTAFSSDVAEKQLVEKGQRWTPSLVTGVAVDHERRKVVLVSKYDERGVAMCEMPHWIEK